MPHQTKHLRFNRLFSWGHFLSRRYQILLDGGILVTAFLLAYLIRFEFQIPPQQLQAFLAQLPLVVLVQFLAQLSRFKDQLS